MGDLSDADAVAEVLAHLKQDTQLVEAFGGVDHISGLVEGPWPHLVVSPGPGGDLRDLLAVMDPDVLVEVVGPLDGSMGSAALWRLALKTILSVKAMPERDAEPGRAVVSLVRFTGGLVKQPLASGQTRWQANLSVSISPPG